jgi:hypothetical protein
MHWLKTVLFSSLLIIASSLVRADNVVPVASQAIGDYTFILFAHPMPLRVGPTRLEACLIQTETGKPITDTRFQAVLNPVALNAEPYVTPLVWCGTTMGNAMSSDTQNLNFQSTGSSNQLLQSVNCTFNNAGEWQLDIQIDNDQVQHNTVQIILNVDEPLTPIQSNWPLLFLPLLGILVYVFSHKQYSV